MHLNLAKHPPDILLPVVWVHTQILQLLRSCSSTVFHCEARTDRPQPNLWAMNNKRAIAYQCLDKCLTQEKFSSVYLHRRNTKHQLPKLFMNAENLFIFYMLTL